MGNKKDTRDIVSLSLGEVQFAVDAMFGYLRNVLYYPKQARLDPEQLPEPFRDLATGILFVGKCVDESRNLANELSRGNLSTTASISPDNEVASGLKNLQATLKHISWQVGQIAKGDYNQHLSFAGAFSDAVNDMVAQLRERNDAMRAEIFLTQQLADDSRNTVLLLDSITKNIEELIIVADRATHEWLYTNHEPRHYLLSDESLEEIKVLLNLKIDGYGSDTVPDQAELEGQAAEVGQAGQAAEVGQAGQAQTGAPLQGHLELSELAGFPKQVFSVVGFPITWMDRKSMVLKLVDITLKERQREELEKVAFFDTLTGIYSRHYGMITLERWISEKQEFILAFVDMDGLKYVNDTFGHDVGDQYLLDITATLSDFGRHAVICRLGGDEFMLLLRYHSAEQAKERLNEMRTRLNEGIEGEHRHDRSFSYGLVDVDRENSMSASSLLSLADENMYEDKRSRKKERRAQN